MKYWLMQTNDLTRPWSWVPILRKSLGKKIFDNNYWIKHQIHSLKANNTFGLLKNYQFRIHCFFILFSLRSFAVKKGMKRRYIYMRSGAANVFFRKKVDMKLFFASSWSQCWSWCCRHRKRTFLFLFFIVQEKTKVALSSGQSVDYISPVSLCHITITY